MTLRQLNSLMAERKRLAATFQSLLMSRNTIIDNFQSEYLRHFKLNSKKEEPRKSLLDSLSRSRNMKKINKEFLLIKGLIKENQKQAKIVKKTYQQAQKLYEATILEQREEKNNLFV